MKIFMKSYFTIFYSVTLCLSFCTIQSAGIVNQYRFLKPDEFESNARFITDETAQKPHMLFVQRSNATGKYESRVFLAMNKAFLSHNEDYIISKYIDEQGVYNYIKTPHLIYIDRTTGKSIIKTISF